MAETIHALIEAHRAAAVANIEAHVAQEFRKPGLTEEELAPLLEASDACFDAEAGAWNALLSAPCLSASDVQTKLAYALDSDRLELTKCAEDGIDDPLGFIQSLRLPAPPADPFVERMRRYHADVDAYNNSGRDDDVDPWHAFEEELEVGAVGIGSAAGAAMALRQVVALDAVGCVESEMLIAKTIGFLDAASVTATPTVPDPLLALVAEYRSNYDAAFAAWEASHDDALDEAAAATWKPLWDRLCDNPPAATSLAGVQAALQLVHSEAAKDTGSVSSLTPSLTSAALAYFGRA